MSEATSISPCPVCGSAGFGATELAVTIPSILHRWEEALKTPFNDDVWNSYRVLGDQPIMLHECLACGYGSFVPIVSGTAKFYEAISAVDYYNAEKWEFFCAAADVQAAKPKRVLDVGCGSGIFLDYLKKRMPEAELYGFDLNEALLVQLANRGFGVLPNNPDLFPETLADKEPFDVICMLQVLEHVANPFDFFASFISLLRPGGLMIITTPNAAGPIKRFPDALTELPPHHLSRWTPSAFAAFLPRYGLSIRSNKIEPLPDYLWDTYLPEVWDEPIWPAIIYDPIARNRGLYSVGERSGMAAQFMKDAGIRWLHGVPGHTLYIAARLEDI